MKKQSAIFAPGEGPYMEKDIQLPGEDYAIDISQQLSEKDTEIGGEMSKTEYNIIGILLPYNQNETIFKILIPELKKVKAQEKTEHDKIKDKIKDKINEIFDYIVKFFRNYQINIKETKYVMPSEEVLNFLAANLFAFFPQYSKDELDYIIGLVGDLLKKKYYKSYNEMRADLSKIDEFFENFLEGLASLRKDYRNYLVNKIKKSVEFKYDEQEVEKRKRAIQKIKDLFLKAVDIHNRLTILEEATDRVKEAVFIEDAGLKELKKSLKDIAYTEAVTAKYIGKTTEIENQLTKVKQTLHDFYAKIGEIIAMFENKILNRIQIDVLGKVRTKIEFVFPPEIEEIWGEKPVSKEEATIPSQEFGQLLYQFDFTFEQFKKFLGDDRELIDIANKIEEKGGQDNFKIKTIITTLKQDFSQVIQLIDAIITYLKDPQFRNKNKDKITEIDQIISKLEKIKERYIKKTAVFIGQVSEIEKEVESKLTKLINEIIEKVNIEEYLEGVKETIELVDEFSKKGLRFCKKIEEVIQYIEDLEIEEVKEIGLPVGLVGALAHILDEKMTKISEIYPTTKGGLLTKEQIQEIYNAVEEFYQHKGELSKEMLKEVVPIIKKTFDLVGEFKNKIDNILKNMKEGDTIHINEIKNLYMASYRQLVSLFEKASGAEAFSDAYKMAEKFLSLLKSKFSDMTKEVIDDSFLPIEDIEILKDELENIVKNIEDNLRGFGLKELFVVPPLGKGAVFTFQSPDSFVRELGEFFQLMKNEINAMKDKLKSKREEFLRRLNNIAKKINNETSNFIKIYKYYPGIAKIKSPDEVIKILENKKAETNKNLQHYNEIEKMQDILDTTTDPHQKQDLMNQIKAKKEEYFGSELAYNIFKQNIDYHRKVIDSIDLLLSQYDPKKIHEVITSRKELAEKILLPEELPDKVKAEIEGIISRLKSEPDITKKAEKIVFDNPFTEFDLSDKTLEEVIKNGKKKIVVTKKKKKTTANNKIDEFDEGEEVKYLDNDKLIDAVVISRVSDNEYYISTFDSIKKVSKDLIFKLEEEDYAAEF